MNATKYFVGQTLNTASAVLESAQTSAPDHYSEDTLMDDMMAAYKFATNDADRALLKTISGIGTSRTRGAIIKAFIDRGFLVRQKKGKRYQLHISPEGRALLAGLPDAIKDVKLTAKWERALELVASGAAKPEQLREKVNTMLVDLVDKLLPKPPAKMVKVL